MKWFSCAVLASLLATSACGGASGALGDAGSDPADSGQIAVDTGTGSSSEAGSGGATCGAATACGSAGATYEECTTTGPGGECVAIVYQTSDGRAFTCAGCTGCGPTQHDLAAYCSSQPRGDAGTVDSGAPVDSGADATDHSGTTCLPAAACGSLGLTYTECTTTDRVGACAAIAYQVSDGNVYTCASCSDCSAAIQQLDGFCTTQTTPTTTCTALSPCESSPLLFQQCTTSLGGTCQSVAYQTSNGQSFACASCSDCSSALSSLDAYCTAQTTPVTTCGSSSACGLGGATYDQCTTAQGAVCDSVAYQTSTGKAFTCNTCGDCTAALTSLETYCASLTATGGVVMFGGFDSTGAGLGDTWVWNGSTWTAGPVGPAARGDAVGATLGGRFILFGGIASTAATTNYGDTWAFSGTAWTELSTTGPAARFGSATATSGNEIILFGGDDTNTATTNLADTWLWSGTAWSTLSVSGPPARVGAAAASLSGQIVVFGGMGTTSTYLADTWVWNGTQWTQMTPATSPPGRFYPSVATLNGQIVMFGGSNGADLADTWTWNGSTWTQLTATGPTARAGATATAWNGGIVLFGGSAGGTYQSDTWVWNGSSWVSKAVTGPAARFGAAMGAF